MVADMIKVKRSISNWNMTIDRRFRCRKCKEWLFPTVDTGKIITRKGKKYRVVYVECVYHGVQYHWEEVKA